MSGSCAAPRLFAWQPFAEALVAAGIDNPAGTLRISGSTFVAMQRDGLTAFQADRLACRIGLHPSAIWPNWYGAAVPA